MTSLVLYTPATLATQPAPTTKKKRRKARRKKETAVTHAAIRAARQDAEPPAVSLKVLRGLASLGAQLAKLTENTDPESDEGYALMWLARFTTWHIARIAKVKDAA